MLGRRRKAQGLVEAVPPLVEQLAKDEKLRRSTLTAFSAGVRARNRLLASLGLAGLGWRVANDPVLQAQLRDLVAATGDLVTRAERLRARRRRRQRLLVVGGLGLAGGAAAAASALLREQGRVEQSIELEVPVSTAYEQWTQFEEFPQFMQGVEEVRQLVPGRLQWVTVVAGRRRAWEVEIELHPDERVAWHATSGKANSGVVTFHRLSDARSKVMVQMQFEPEGLRQRLGSRLGIDSRRVKGDLERFKSLIESRQHASGAWRGDIEHGDVTQT